MNRREFLRAASLTAIGAPMIISSRALGRSGAVAPSNRIAVGFVGLGGQGMANLKQFMNDRRVHVAALCDVDRRHAAAGLQTLREQTGSGCPVFRDFRDVTRRPEVDIVVISTPDHWHTLPALDAARHGKDVYVEKPLTLTIQEGRVLSDELKRYGRIAQTGSQQRTYGEFRRVCELVRNGRIGQLRSIDIVIPDNNVESPSPWKSQIPPADLDYDFWLGPAPYEAYHEKRCHYSFRFLSDYSGGQVTNWGTHYIDIAQWGLDMDASGPVAVRGAGTFPKTGLFDTATTVDFECDYANGVTLRCRTGSSEGGIKFTGISGWIFVNRETVMAQPSRLVYDSITASEEHLPASVHHAGNLLDCFSTREQPVAHAEAGHRSATVCHLGNIAMLLKRRLRWDPQKEEFIGEDEANRMRSRPQRAPWTLGAPASSPPLT